MEKTDLSLILPIYNEEACIEQTLEEARGVLLKMSLGFEILAVDDGSTDRTREILTGLKSSMPELRVLCLTPNCGQSAAMGAGFRAARGEIIVLMDADGQNDPADIPPLLKELEGHDMCCGYRASRKDSAAKRYGSKLANRVRNWALKEDIVDTGCTLKVCKAEFLRDIEMWRGMHRFLPALVRMKGASIKQMPVNHRPRQAGQSKYTNLGRLKETVHDLRAVRWMQKRYRNFTVEEI